MIGVKEATRKAQEYLKELFPNIDSRYLQLEEVELTEDKKFWFITLSFPDQELFMPMYPTPKEYKQFKIDSTSGQILSMKIRQIK